MEIFPQLRKLILWGLPELKTICSSSNVILCDSLNSISISGCPKLKRLPLSLHLIDGELSSPPSSLQIEIEKEWWELLEWDNHDMKMVLDPFIRWVWISLFTLHLCFIWNDSICWLSISPPPRFLSNLFFLFLLVPFTPPRSGSEISRFTWLFLCKSNPEHTCLYPF